MRPQETATVRRRAGPLLPALARVQKTRGARLGSCSHFGASAAVASSSLASHKTHETGSIWLQRSASDLCAAVRHRSDCETTSSAAAETKAAASNFAWPCAGRYDATDGVSAGHLRRFGAAARKKCATAIARREAGTARSPPTRRPLQKAAQQHAVASTHLHAIAATHDSMPRHRTHRATRRRAATPTARPARPSTRRPRSRTRTTRSTRS